MARNIAFYLPRTPFLKVFGPLLDHLLEEERGLRPLVLVPRWQPYKPDQEVAPDHVRSLFGPDLKIVEMENRADLGPTLEREAVEAVICLTPAVHDLDPPQERALLEETRAKGIKWVSLPGVLDEALLVARDPARYLPRWDLICTLGPAGVDWAESYLRRTAPEMASLARERMVATGHPEFDALKSMDQAAIRTEYGLPRDKPIIFLSTACASPGVAAKNLAGLTKRGLNVRFRGLEKPRPRDLAGLALSLGFPTVITYRTYLASLRELAERNGAVIAAKSRAKHEDPDYLDEYADYRFGDGSYYPFLTLELMAASSLYFGFQSACSLEALAAGVYSVNAVIYNMWAYAEGDGNRALNQELFYEPGGFWNLPGMSRVLTGSRRSTRKELAELSRADLDGFRFDPGPSRGRAEELLAYSGRSSARVAEVLAAIL